MSGSDESHSIILASTSPRRVELLRSLGIEFELAPRKRFKLPHIIFGAARMSGNEIICQKLFLPR